MIFSYSWHIGSLLGNGLYIVVSYMYVCIYIIIFWGLDIKNQYCLSKCYPKPSFGFRFSLTTYLHTTFIATIMN